MSNEMNAKVRTVRCPKCLHLLQEPADFPVYKCGGCGTILQAKRRKNDSTDPQPSCTPVKAEQPRSSAENETNGPHEESSLSPERDDTLKGKTGIERNQDEKEQCGGEKLPGSESQESSSPFCPSGITRELESPESHKCTEAADQSPANESVSSENTTRIRHENSDKEISRGLDRSFYDCYDGSASSCDGEGEILSVDKVPFFMNCHGSPSTSRKSDFGPPSSGIIDPEPDRMELVRTIYELEDQICKMRLQSVANANRDPFHMNTMNSRGSPSTYRKSDFGPSSSTVAADPAGPDRIELLRKMIYELEDQIEKIRRGNGNCLHSTYHSRQSQIPRMPFSGVVHRCSAQLPFSGEVQHCSAQLPGGCIYCNTPCSSSPSPGHSSLSSLERFHLREKYAKMRHLLPVASGAPIIACHYCSEMLKIPADFGLFKRRFHRLRCHACRNILRFSVQNGKHVVPHFKEMVAPPPSEDDDISNGTPENVGRESASPLHRLMGYSSVSQVMKE
ncbi:hypothetical protein DM860_013642 [Cuscuta australis]|uniref:Uncharacterized protein n=1 Tax=Cuscuta australis TaxID=267555 RepID=A0A328EC50_9ASTE|nr:hypothetical protein DM860_013642 [Cuscuta australis]